MYIEIKENHKNPKVQWRFYKCPQKVLEQPLNFNVDP